MCSSMWSAIGENLVDRRPTELPTILPAMPVADGVVVGIK